MGNKARGTPFIDLGDPADIQVGTEEIADFIEAFCIGVPDRTTAQRDADPKWVGKLIFNKTLGLYQACTAVGPPAVWSSDPMPVYSAALAAHTGGLDGADKHVQKIADGKALATLPNTYPSGFSYAAVIPANGWPDFGNVMTLRDHGNPNRAWQVLRQAGGNKTWARSSDDATGAWTTLVEYPALSVASTWTALQTFAAGIKQTGTGVQRAIIESTSGGHAGVLMIDGDAPADQRRITVRSDNGLCKVVLTNDADNTETVLLQVDATGRIFFGTALDVMLKRASSSAATLRNAADSAYNDLFVNFVLTNRIQDLSDSTRNFRWGSGSPEGAVTASSGSVFFRRDGGDGTTVYEKISGTGNTGWRPIGTSSQGNAVLVGAQAAIAANTWTKILVDTLHDQADVSLSSNTALLNRAGRWKIGGQVSVTTTAAGGAQRHQARLLLNGTEIIKAESSENPISLPVSLQLPTKIVTVSSGAPLELQVQSTHAVVPISGLQHSFITAEYLGA
jgi:hypothetical protein